MFISPKYTLSDRLQAGWGVSCGYLSIIIGASFDALFMSGNIAERPTFEKELFAVITFLHKYTRNLSISNFSHLIFTSNAEFEI